MQQKQHAFTFYVYNISTTQCPTPTMSEDIFIAKLKTASLDNVHGPLFVSACHTHVSEYRGEQESCQVASTTCATSSEINWKLTIGKSTQCMSFTGFRPRVA